MELVVRAGKTPPVRRFLFSFIRTIELESDEVYIIKGVETLSGGYLAFLQYEMPHDPQPQDICIFELAKNNVVFPPGKAKYTTVEVPDYINISQQSAIVKHTLPPTKRKIKV